MTTNARRKEYICPGESYSISRSVHLARLASFYPPCRECPYRTETGQLPARTVDRLRQTERRIDRPTLFTPEGVRGVYLNELSRAKAAQITSAFAALLLEQSPRIGRIGSGSPAEARRPPVVIVGADQRPSSPDIATGVVSALRRMGCAVVDLGPTTVPCLWFNVRHRQAAGGVMITGSGRDPSWTGLDFVDAGGRPVSMQSGEPEPRHEGISLNAIERLAAGPVDRASRSAGGYGTARGFAAYVAGLAKHFHALRPLRVVAACPAPLVHRALQRLFDALPCRLSLVEIPQRARDVCEANDADVVRVGRAVSNQNAHLGVLIDADGMGCGFVDERGRLVSPIEITRLLLKLVEPGSAIVIEQPAGDNPMLKSALSELSENESFTAASTRAAMFDAMRSRGAEFGGGGTGRFWFRDASPSCDAILATAAVLRALSESDAPFSEVVDGLRAEREGLPAAVG